MKLKQRFSSFVDFDLIDRIVGVSPCHPQARTRSPPQGPSSELLKLSKSPPSAPGFFFSPNVGR